ncbi:LysR family transcriptional regulator [Lapidilactobacillus wuchangensis]|uniref:LysR family transcriptional regulator n=1 Tax=Lapidilactobacillus wuchangensis TaxID=2486001 RepID=UPI000F769229|nr:LysR family transcriptional regulator [Lapidilactobacillus wuchangensis]
MFQQMQYFIAVVQQHSFTKAAEVCNISQSAISQQIKELENYLDVTLLERSGRSFTVTPAGQYFYRHSQEILANVEQLVANTKQMKQTAKPMLHLAYLRSFGTAEFLEAVAAFSKTYPQVEIKISSGNHEQLFNLLRDEKVDLIFSDQRRALSNAYVNEALTSSPFMVAVSRAAFNGMTQQIQAADLVDLPCLLLADNGQQATEEDYYRDVLGVRSKFQLVNSYDEAQMLIAANQGFLIINQRTQSLLNSAVVRLYQLVNSQQQLSQNYYAFWKQDNSGFYIETFAELLQQKFQE